MVATLIALVNLALVTSSQPASSPTAIWMTTGSLETLDFNEAFNDYSGATVFYIPLPQNQPPLSALQAKQYFEKEKQFYQRAHANHILVYGIFEPLNYDQKGWDALIGRHPDWQELDWSMACTSNPRQWNLLSLYNEDAVHFMESELENDLDNGRFDGIVTNLNYTTEQLFGYSVSARKHFVSTLGFDPIDVDFPVCEKSTLPEAKSLSPEVQDTINDRMNLFLSVVSRIDNICRSRLVRASYLGNAELDQYNAAGRSSEFCDWREVLKRDPDDKIVLRYGFLLKIDSAYLVRMKKMIDDTKEGARISFLLPITFSNKFLPLGLNTTAIVDRTFPISR